MRQLLNDSKQKELSSGYLEKEKCLGTMSLRDFTFFGKEPGEGKGERYMQSSERAENRVQVA